jgi:hypothetical protein
MLHKETLQVTMPRTILIKLRNMKQNPPYLRAKSLLLPQEPTPYLPLESTVSPLQGCNLNDTKRRLTTLNANTTLEPHHIPAGAERFQSQTSSSEYDFQSQQHVPLLSTAT